MLKKFLLAGLLFLSVCPALVYAANNSYNQPYGLMQFTATGEVPYTARRLCNINTVTSSSTSFVDVANSSFSISANEVWSFDFTLKNGCNGTGGLSYTLVAPSGANLVVESIGSTSGSTAFRSDVITSSSTPTGALNTVVSANGVTFIRGVVASALPGTVQLQIKSVVNGQTSTVYAGSFMVAQRIP